MNKTELINSVSRTVNRACFQIQRKSPEILIVAGVVGVVTSAVMACKATTKVSAIMDKTKEDVDVIHECAEAGYVENPENGEKEEYTKDDSKKDLTIVYTQTGLKFVKLYGPAIVLGALSLTAIVMSHNILRKRNIALAAAYTTVDRTFKEYRGRVVERFGDKLDRELRYNIKSKEIEETVVDEDGNEKTVKRTVDVVDPSTLRNDTSVIYSEGNIGWTKDPEFNKMFLLKQQAYANELLERRGHVFLNEIYDMLGFNRTAAGSVLGWYYDKKKPMSENLIDFGIYDIHDERKIAFVNGDERNIILDFNYHGDIRNLI